MGRKFNRSFYSMVAQWTGRNENQGQSQGVAKATTDESLANPWPPLYQQHLCRSIFCRRRRRTCARALWVKKLQEEEDALFPAAREEVADDRLVHSDSNSDCGVDPPVSSSKWMSRLHTDQEHSSAVGFSVKCPDQSGPPDISRSRAEGPVQLQLAVFPRTAMGGAQRNFQASWYSHHTWIEYSQCKDAVYCYACRNFVLPNTDSVFTSDRGYKNGKKAMLKDRGFASHAKCEAHINVMLAWKKQVIFDVLIVTRAQKKTEENRDYIKSVAEVLLSTATLNITQRGHKETVDSGNKGNFVAILEVLGNHDLVMKKKLKTVNAKYTSNQSENELLDTLAEMVRSTIISEVKESQVFALMTDETKDAKKKEQISLVLRYYYRGTVKGSFLHFKAAEHLNAAGLANKIIHILEKYGLEYRDNLGGQVYD
ncbi:zinc finger MYM-type protein 1 [Cheilinus undulatus]|uniref:zinc finger MYM-type protein 1 n=1 Tax=Cheilinus undulatus TaxID=241271 RepID=UPI001BD36875|nr:zinc finger MYM-type protein 1 [Cheilinus undulatus]